MSLDIYATLKRGAIPSGQKLGTGYRTWSREERDRLTEPTNEVLWINITHNLTKMASHIPTLDTTLYQIMWRPDEYFKEENYSKYDGDKTYDTDLVLDYVNNHLDLDVSNEDWFNGVKEFASRNGYASSPKDYKKEPDKYKGHVGDICEAIRVMITGRTKSPDLYSIMKILGKDKILERISLYKEHIK